VLLALKSTDSSWFYEYVPRSVLPGGFLLVICKLTSYNTHMIKSFRHKGIKDFFETGSKAEIQPSQAARLRVQLTRLDAATNPQDMNAPGWCLHKLSGKLLGYWSITVNGNWRLTFSFEGTDVVLVDYQDYH
jgi:proteic killer suppression protein